MDYFLKITFCMLIYLTVTISAQRGSYNGYGVVAGSNRGDTPPDTRDCTACERKGRYYTPNAKFSYKDDCFMLNCFCYCNGTYVCKKEDSVYLCGRGTSSSSGRSSSQGGTVRQGSSSQGGYTRQSSGSSGRGVSSGGRTSGTGASAGSRSRTSARGNCLACTPDGMDTSIPTETYFNYKNGCLEYTDCYCGCDGYWQCSEQRAINLCSSAGHGTIVGRSEDGSCRQCDTTGLLVDPNTYFTYRNGCMQWSNCRCECSGDWQCPSDQGRWICDNICRECDINGTIHRANTDFRYKKGCFEYYPCRCHCNGTWNCPAENGRWACSTCRTCDVEGSIQQGDTIFTHREDCWEWDQCKCHCNGSWSCPRENARWVCHQCRQCDVNGTVYDGSTNFQITKGCFQFNCECACNGTWNCPANRIIDTCHMNVTTGCYFCDVQGTRYQGNTQFSHKDGCLNYTSCTCNCDGSWECLGRNAIDTCRQNETTGCYYCDVRNRRVQGEARFQLNEGCWRFECDCNCDGSWRCHGDTAVYTCGSISRPGQCRECYAGGARIAARQSFELSWGCINYQCQCDCSGTWFCSASRARIVCERGSFQEFQIRSISSTPSSWCSDCYIDGNVYPAYSHFEYQSNCVKQAVRCYCSGSFRKTTSVVSSCLLGGSLTGSSTSIITSSSSTTRTCKNCYINAKSYQTNSPFELNVGCSSYSCQCSCGIPQCQSGTRNLCNTVISAIGQVSGGSTIVQGGGTSGGSIVVGSGSSSSSSSGTLISGPGGTRVVGGKTVVIGREGGTRIVGGGSRTVVVGTGGSRSSGTIVTGGGGSSTTVIGRRTVVVGGTNGGGVISGTGRHRCLPCIVEGRRYRGGTTFEFRQGCRLKSCRCDCITGRAFCTVAEIDCLPQRCFPCVVHDRRYQPNTDFQYQRDCEMLTCTCGCNGKETCTSRRIPNCRPDTCERCNVGGRLRQPESDFDLQDGCLRYRCHCGCNGVHKCSAPINTCGGGSEECREFCTFNGVRYPTNTPFMYERGCWRMPCRCDCDGYHNCDRNRAEYTCDVNPPEPPKERCVTHCISGGRTYEPNSKFTRQRGCLTERCQCFCTGRVRCVRTNIYACARGNVIDTESGTSSGSSTVVRTGSTSGGSARGSSGSSRGSTTGRRGSSSTTSRGSSGSTSRGSAGGRTGGSSSSSSTTGGERRDNCTGCVADGRKRPIGTSFYLDRGCNRYTCKCDCNRVACETGTPENICDDRGRPRCKDCVVSDQTYEANSRFQLDYDECRKYQCNCNCNGTYDCSVINTCDSRRTCTNCLHNDQMYAPNTRFYYTQGCEKYNCSCECDGMVNCPSDLIEDVCTPEGDSGNCRNCIVEGRTYPPNRRFQYDENCYRKDCTCRCDGSWKCPTSRTRYICNTDSDEQEPPQHGGDCKPCDVTGRMYRPNARFQFDDGCDRFDCDCHCNGSWTCPQERMIDLCSDDDDRQDRGQCTECEVQGRRYSPNTRFAFEDGCYRYDCDCRCNGSWVCPAGRTRDLCGDDGGGSDQSGQCRPCIVNGRSYRPESRFQYDSACDRFDCDCRCNGSWVCPAERTQDLCRGRDTDCRPCVVNNRSYRPNSIFQFDSGCNRFNCDCRCNGSWVCPAERTRNICGGRRDTDVSGGCRDCVVKGRSYRPNTRFQFDSDCNRFDCDCRCNGSWVCPAERTRNICGGRRDTDVSGGCRDCVVKGRSYRPNTRFQFDSDCNRFDCDCQCNGSWVCPAERTRNICGGRPDTDGSGGCRDCVVKGRSYRPNTRFQFDSDCNRFDCDCRCNGSWVCPAERTRNICGGRPDTDGSGGCRDCVVKGRSYRPNTRFQFDSDCNRFDCDCRCNGSWVCPAERTRNICGGRRDTDGSGGCRDCVVKGRSYRPNTRFQFDSDCNRFDCDCGCNGSWVCPAERTRDICGGRPNTGDSGGCRECVVKGRSYRPNTRFQFDSVCNRFDCDCRCNGSWVCPAERTRNICGSRPDSGDSSGCRECVVKGRSYRPNTRFQFDSDCNRFDCDCRCNGSWVCPAERTRDICGGRRRPSQPNERGTCRECVIDDQAYAPNTRFKFDKDCNRFDCDCYCNGTYVCPAERTRRICRSDEPNDIEEKCKNCTVDGKTYLPETDFKFKKGCNRFSCECHCDGFHSCLAKYTENICGGESRPCIKKCDVHGVTYPGNSIFVLREQCLQMQCQCHCDGKWDCDESNVVNACKEEERN